MRVCTLAHELQLSKEEMNSLEIAGKLHDVGKIGVPASIIKKPGPFTPEEWKIAREHPHLGFIILQFSVLFKFDNIRLCRLFGSYMLGIQQILISLIIKICS